MGGVKKVPRLERTATTRRRMLDAAYDLFCEQGFRATTMDAIAQRAGVAVQTLYFTFHTKDALLQEVHNRTVLGEEAIPPDRQAWRLAAEREPDIRRSVALTVDGTATVLGRVAPMIPVFHAVSADPAGAIYRHGEELRRRGYADLADELVGKAPLRPDISKQRANDLLFVLLGPEIYRSLVIEAGWTHEQWATWTTNALLRDLFGLQPDTP